jgi:hypothetical protein
MLTQRHVRRALVWAGLACGVGGILVYILSVVAPIVYKSPSRTVVVGAGAVYIGWNMSNVLHIPEPGSVPVTHGGDLQHPLPETFSVGQTVTSFGPMATQKVFIRAREGWFPAVRDDRPQWRIGGSGRRNWLWYPQLKEGGSGPGNLALPAWLLVLAGTISAYFLLPPGTAPGTCRQCSFDLTGTPPLPGRNGRTSRVRCPECGLINVCSHGHGLPIEVPGSSEHLSRSSPVDTGRSASGPSKAEGRGVQGEV